MEFTGNALVVGGGSGIGKATCLAFAKAGVPGLVVADLYLDAAQKVAAEAEAVAANNSFQVEAVQVDVAIEKSVDDAVDLTVRSFGRLDYCVICAGIGTPVFNETAEVDTQQFIDTLNVNTTGTMLVTRAASKVMRSQEAKPADPSVPEKGEVRGTIVTTGSSLSLHTAPGFLPYTTSKHAVLGLTKTAALDNTKHKIRVNCVCPGWVDTGFLDGLKASGPGIDEAIAASVPWGRIARPEEIADAILFLSGPKSTFITGSPLIVDGGITLATAR